LTGNEANRSKDRDDARDVIAVQRDQIDWDYVHHWCEQHADQDVHLYYAPSDRVFLCVVTARAGDDERFVVTAYFTKNINKGKELRTS
jgi:hypothetical protein